MTDRRRSVIAHAARGDRADQGARGVSGDGAARGRRAGAQSAHDLSRGAGPGRARVVSQVPRARRAGGGGAARARARSAPGVGERSYSLGDSRPGTDVTWVYSSSARLPSIRVRPFANTWRTARASTSSAPGVGE